MPREDADRWDERYRDDQRYATFEAPRPLLVEYSPRLPAEGLAIDVAMGLGGNAGFLLERGFRVIGVDISGVAVRRAKARLPGLMAVQADLTRFWLPPHRFDLILNFYYLQRDLWPAYLQALRPGGLLFFETLTLRMLELLPETDPTYLLAPGELRQAFEGLEILHYEERWATGRSGRPRAVASLVARKPAAA